MRKELVIAMFGLMLVMPMALALPTTIDIKTLPNHDVDITFLDPADAGYSVFNKTKGFSDYYGDLSVTFEVTQNSFDIGVFVKDGNGNKVIYERFTEDYTPGSKLSFEVAPPGYEFKENPLEDNGDEEEVEEVSNDTEEVEEVVAEESEEEVVEDEEVVEEEEVSEEVITGNVVGNVTAIINESKYYFLGVIVLVIVIVGSVAMFKSKGRGIGEVKKAIMHSDNKPPTILADAELEDAEKRLGEAERELKDVKAKYTRKAAAQEKFREAQKELADAEKSFGDAKEDSEE
jgi:ABC-type multidrug transport system fused ATPase/permease subunit